MAKDGSTAATDGTTTGSGDIARSLELLWGTGDRPSRGPKPGLSLDRIVTAAIAVADAEGLTAVSMRRLSTELGTGTMSLYRYVPGKAELLDLMLDRVLGEPLPGATGHHPTGTGRTAGADHPSEAPPADWRASVDAMARTYRENLRRHPWLLKINQARTVLGPSALRGLELSLTGLRSMGLRDPELIGVIVTVNSFVEGIARTRADAAEAVRETGLSDQEFWDNQRPYLERAMLSGAYPMMASLSEDTFSAEFDHFDFGLRRLIAGFEALVAERTVAGAVDGAPDRAEERGEDRAEDRAAEGTTERTAARK
ncbi:MULTISPECIES: TetR/AcrR family transcriptional regulator [Streptomyces]|uniref:TetR-family transcriptional regulator n=1 Tax=Streptomyces griseus subsp. griseus (strain JCM 4626 / CBS 651.72 / NBRC 13350 / KCC S-0626 / ISP 5235) TaxID=455632 RepID=B1VKS0_STRGG|nr:TetR/AcrR family transcriptional regulator [Streptomyces griseus]MBW3705590.1 TetR/AcrR family transcriptional regulator [Streptomyces griseus]BAG19948.1 putative TetR-family transcriptional regulator [Streptomyces griseus subsp. griseus NBRC 13350]SEE85366.1 DNA-binding transcriptional regulator, AcrR family [Streptomyces griseus]SQA21938.1 TetR family transcriptional regulator [Streptomyces griseus]